MPKQLLSLSPKFQVVIPKAARKKMGLTKGTKHSLVVKRVTKDEITFKKSPGIEEYFGALSGIFPRDATAAIRKMRDEEWD